MYDVQFWRVAKLLYLVLFEGFKVDFPCNAVTEVYTKILDYTSYWIDFLATYSRVKMFSFKFSFKDNYFSFTYIEGYFIAL